MNKSVVLMLYVVALYFIFRAYYNQGNSGLPNPRVMMAPTYLYAILALSADFLGGFPIVIALGLTVALIWQTQTSSKTQPKKG